jgi:putative DNA methylase
MAVANSTLLDAAALPVEQLARLALRESVRPRPIYQAHKWFARRFGSAFRALLVASALPEGADFWAAFYGGVDLAGQTVLDPFVGGGTSVVDALRLGASVVGVDVDAVACAVTRWETRAGIMPDLTDPLALLKEGVGASLAEYYTSRGPLGDQTVLHFFWVQVVDCVGCGERVEAHPNFQLAYEAERRESGRQWAFCKSCHGVQELPVSRKRLDCADCCVRTIVAQGTVTRGRVRCPRCGTAERLIQVARRTGQSPSWYLFALEVLDNPPTQRRPLSERSFRAATDHDRVVAGGAAAALDGLRDSAGKLPFVPEAEIPQAGRSDDRLPAYGYRRYRDMFLPRQLLHLSTLAAAIDSMEGPLRETLALALSDHLTTNCVQSSYAAGWRRLAPLFAVRAYRHIPRPVEINPWLDGIGRGTFPNAVRQIQRAILDARTPKEACADGGFVLTPPPFNVAPFVRIIHGNTQARLPLEPDSVDLVLSDPPYFDNVFYPELSDFFFPWLQQLGLVHGQDEPRLAFEHGLASARRDAKAAEAFGAALGRCFSEIARVLRPGGRMTFTYRHQSPGAWSALATAFAGTDLRPVQVFPMLGEGPGSLHEHPGTALWDAVFVAQRAERTQRNEPLVIGVASRRRAEVHAQCWASRLTGSTNPTLFRAADHLNLLRACLIATALGTFGDEPEEHAEMTLHDALEQAGGAIRLPLRDSLNRVA